MAVANITLNVPTASANQQPLMRFPTVSATRIAFVAYGNLWIVPRGGGAAMRLTNDPGQVLMPRFSPDGTAIAFTWRREGGSDVYVMSALGGMPTRLTHGPTLDPYDNLVTGWTPDGAKIVFISLRQTPFHRYETYTVPITGGLATAMGLDHSGLSSLSPDGQRIVFDRTFRNMGGDRWKRYVGGQAPDLYIQDIKRGSLERLTDWQGIDTAPMWVGRRIYFLSDRGMERRANIWVTNLDTRQTRQITHFVDYDIDMPSVGPGGIGFQQGGRLYVLDTSSDALQPIKVAVPDDPRMLPHLVPATSSLGRNDIAGQPDYALGADGHTAYLVARGDVLRVSLDGTSQNLTHTVNAMEDHPVISPDGRQLAFVTDADGEQQIAVVPVEGKQAPHILTRFQSGVLYAPRWSPDALHMVVADANKRLWLVRVSDGHTEQIAADRFAEIHDAIFSHDGVWIAYSSTRQSQTRAIHLRNLSTGVDTVISPSMESDHDPVFSADGHHLFFISQRREQPFISDRDREGTVATIKSEAMFEVALPASMSDANLAEATAQATLVPIELHGGIASLAMAGETLFYRATAASGIGDDLPGEISGLHAFDTRTRKDRVVAANVDGYVLSPDAHAALIRRGDGWHCVSTDERTQRDEKVVTDSLTVGVDPRAEALAMFEQAWKLDRDLFWDRAMNGVDWQLVHDRYVRLVPAVGSHEDMIYLLGEMQGELSTSHMFVGGGDQGDPRPHVGTALLGVDFAIDAASGRYRMMRIYRGDPGRGRFRAPLGDRALGVQDGEFLLAIDGQRLVVPDDPYRLLLGKHGPVSLIVGHTAADPGRAIMVQPTDDESEIRKLDWISRNRVAVDRLSSGKAGYIYLSDFDELGSEDFLRQFYPQQDKAALVIDVRDNRGGFTSQWVLDILRRPLAGQFRNREGGITALPGAAGNRALAVVTNIFSMSDGDQFPFFFRQWQMGPVIGQRTWGGVRGIKGPWRLMDGTFITVPKDSLFAPNGAAIIENQGAQPDIIVDDTPGDTLAGRDPQLEAAVTAVIRLLPERDCFDNSACRWFSSADGARCGASNGHYRIAHSISRRTPIATKVY